MPDNTMPLMTDALPISADAAEDARPNPVAVQAALAPDDHNLLVADPRVMNAIRTHAVALAHALAEVAPLTERAYHLVLRFGVEAERGACDVALFDGSFLGEADAAEAG